MKFKEMNIPNKLTTIRIICVPLVILFFVLYAFKIDVIIPLWSFGEITLMRILIVAFFAFASITDAIDGKIARKRDLVTDYGKLMDPLADKLLVNTTLMCLIATSMIYNGEWYSVVCMFLVIITIARDIGVDALRMYALKKNDIVVPATIWGKLKTATLMPGIIAVVLGSVYPVILYLGMLSLAVGSIFAIISGVKYYKAIMD